MKRAFSIYGVTWLIFLFFLVQVTPAFGYYGDTDKGDLSLAVSIAGQNTDQNSALTATVPNPIINGWMGVHVNRLIADKKTVSEVVNTRAEGGFSVRGIKLNGYIDLERNALRGIKLASEFGYFIEPGKANISGIEVSGGAGNFTLNEQILEELGREDAPPQKFGWLAFVTGRYKNVSGKVTVFPELQFKDVEVETSISITHAISENVSIGVTGQGCFDSAPFTDSHFITSYMAFLKVGGGQ